MTLWEHFLLIGQFQARPYRFKCTMPVGNSFRLGYVSARGPRCFDHQHYYQQHTDLQSAGLSKASDLFNHFVQFGQFEQRKFRFTCADTLTGLAGGFDTFQMGGDNVNYNGVLETDGNQLDEGVLSLTDASSDSVEPEVRQAIKGTLVTEAVKDLIRGHYG